MRAKQSGGSFPPFTWVRCECGCGFEGEDDVAQFCIEEAFLLLQGRHEQAMLNTSSEPEVSPVERHAQKMAELTGGAV